ncbi:hypothetical protein [Streptomyces sp. RKAG293]|uniref:hypothetical protein n=1 Tax=Streptomyces sp. RKAG293 TaxID=2893403 RepID=UPI002033CFF8|nr:hypothetical protein [Streptomyces sp. RKAG293]MCM2416950.1 hypothetical protein [Streptomyces sp. RKAG293]
MSAIAVDVGARYVRIAHIGPHGTAELVGLPGAVPGEGLPAPAEPGGTHRTTALRAAYTAYRDAHGVPDQVVLVVPQRDRAEHARRGADTLTALHGTGRAPRFRALGTPHAVLALLRHTGTVTAGRYAVCDLGATEARVAVCAVTPGTVAVTGDARQAPADGYAAGFDAALLLSAGLPAEEAQRQALAAVREADGAALRLDVMLTQAQSHPDRYHDLAVHQVAGREITAGAVLRALARLTTCLDQVLDEASDDQPRGAAVVVGGAARFLPLVRHLTERQGESVALPAGVDPALAAVYGAALVAAGRIDPADRYPYAVCVGTHRTVAGRPRDEELLLSAAGALEPGGATVFAEADGQRVRLRTGPEGTAAGRPVRVRVRDTAGRRTAPVQTLLLPDGGEGDRFHVGVRVAVDGTARLVLQPLGTGAPSEYPLGSLPTDLKEVRS